MNREQKRKLNQAVQRSNKKLLREQGEIIKQKALELAALEKEIRNGINAKEAQIRIEKLTSELSYPEIFAIDEYIESHHLLTK